MDSTHLKRRHQTWYARLAVPPSLQAALGKSELVRSLKTRDLREANRVKHAVIAEMQRELSQAAAQATLPRESAEFVLEVAKAERKAVERGERTQQEAEEQLTHVVERYLEEQSKTSGTDAEDGYPLLKDAHWRTLQLANRVLHAGEVALLSQCIKDYLTEKAPHINKQTYREKERQLNELAEWLGGDCEVSTVSKKLAGRYVGDVLLKKGHAPKTVKDTLSNLSAFWRWLEGRGLVEFNVWRGMSSTVRGSSRGTQPKRRPWNDEELLALLQGIPTSDPLFPLVAIAAYTGMRREEVARLRVEDVTEDDALCVREGKTAAALRRVPIHAALKPLIGRLKETSKDGYLIPGLLTGGFDKKRGHYLGKRFGEIKTALGFTDVTLKFHTLRNAFMQRCEEGEVAESTTKLIVGHSRQANITYGIYSPGVKFEALRKAVAKVTFGKLDGYLKKTARLVEITKQSRRRPRASYNRTQRRLAKSAA